MRAKKVPIPKNHLNIMMPSLNPSVLEIIDDFIDNMEAATKGGVTVDLDENGDIIINYESYDHPSIKNNRPKVSTRPAIDFDALYRGDYINNIYK